MNSKDEQYPESWQLEYGLDSQNYLEKRKTVSPALFGVLTALLFFLLASFFVYFRTKKTSESSYSSNIYEPYAGVPQPDSQNNQEMVPNHDFVATQMALETLIASLTDTALQKESPTFTPTPTQTPAPPAVEAEVDKVVIPAGNFMMGASSSDSDARENEKPQHEVYLDAFSIDAYEVSNARYEQFVRATGYQTAAEIKGYSSIYDSNMRWVEKNGLNWRQPFGDGSYSEPDKPVVHIDFYDAYAFCEWAGGRLPTDAEWEKAARGDTGWRYPWGDSFDSSRVVYSGSAGPDDVDSYSSGTSVYGVYHMAGNVFEWTMSYRSDNYYSGSETVDPNNVQSDRWISLRGGGWTSPAKFVRVTHRDVSHAYGANHILGFRCVYP